MGHWQYLPVSYAGFVVGGGSSWNSGSYNESMVKFYLNTSVFNDQNGKMADFVYDLGRYNQFEEILAPNMTLINLGFQFGLMDRVLYHTILSSFPSTIEKLAPEGLAYIIHEKFTLRHPFDYSGLLNYLSELQDALKQANMKNPDADLVFDEFNNAIQLIQIGAALKNYIESEADMSREQKIQYLKTVQQDFSVLLANHETLWLSRNKPGGLERSMKTLYKVHDEIGEELITLDGNLLTRGWERLKDRTIAAAAAVAL